MSHVLVYPADARGCGMYRMIWPGQALYNSGKPVNVMNRRPNLTLDQKGNFLGINFGSATSVVFQRPAKYTYPEAVPLIQSRGIKVIIDMDDSLSTIHPRNAAFKTYDPRISHAKNWMHAAKACEQADLVTVTTEALAEEYGSHGRVVVIPNHVPSSYLSVRRPQNPVPVVGWAGFTSTHVDDLLVTQGAINNAVTETNARFVAFGDEKTFVELGIRRTPPHSVWPLTNIQEYPVKMAGFDIGLVPLKLSTFNAGKSWLKCVEYASLGIVPVASPTPDNLKFAELGGCIIARTPEDWEREVKELILDNDKRAEMSKKVREVASDWTIEDNTEKWWNAWAI